MLLCAEWKLPSFPTAVDKFLYTSVNMPHAVSSSAGSLFYFREHGAVRWTGEACWALAPPQRWAPCTEPGGATIGPVLGPPFTTQFTAICCVQMPGPVHGICFVMQFLYWVWLGYVHFLHSISVALCFGFVTKTALVTQGCFSCCWAM